MLFDLSQFRAVIYRQLEPSAREIPGLSPVNVSVTILICIGALVAVLESEPLIHEGREDIFRFIETTFAIVFGIEYVFRVWAAGEEPGYAGITGRIKYAVTPVAIIDFIALLPMFLVFLGTEAYILRVLRLVRILRLARLGRFSQAITSLNSAIRARGYELAMSLGVALVLLIVSSTLLYLVEGGVQPQAFGSIPRSMWWSVATLTTVGYGDAYPITVLGRIFAGLTAVTGIGLIAMPTGILASAFSDAIQRDNASKAAGRRDANE